MGGATISSDAVIVGPSVIGRDVTIGPDSVVVNSVIWDNARIGSDCGIGRSVIDSRAVVNTSTIVEDTVVTSKAEGVLRRLLNWTSAGPGKHAARLWEAFWLQLGRAGVVVPSWIRPTRKEALAYLAAIVFVAIFIWSYKRGLGDLWNLWHRSDEYSVGMIVPFLALYVLWSRRHALAGYPIKPSIWGLFIFLGAQAIRFFGLFFMYSSAERLSIVLSIAAIVLLLFGWQLFRKVSPILLFLCLMLPPPNLIQNYTVLHLQHWATSSAVFCLVSVFPKVFFSL